MTRVLVTGAGGYIGSITSRRLLESGYDVVALDNYCRGYRDPLLHLQSEYGDRIRIMEGDLTGDGGARVMDQYHDVSSVMHFAALLDVGESWKIPEMYFTNNVCGTQRLLEQCVTHGVRQFVFSSSCVVYGDAQYLPIDEHHPISDPVSPYGMSKLHAERIIADYVKLGLITNVSLRYFNVCGATDDGEMGDSKRPSFHLVQNAVRGALGIAPFELNFARVNTPDGSPIRDYTNVVDLADAHVRALSYLMTEKKSDVFNLGTGTGNSVLEIIEAVKRHTGKDFPVRDASERRKGEADKMIADITKARSMLGWEPKHTLGESVSSLITWYTTHPQGWAQ